MSTPAPSGAADPLQATQQQLDELETLIQRMLTVPVHQLDDEPELPNIPPSLAEMEINTGCKTRSNLEAGAWEDTEASTLADFDVGEKPGQQEAPEPAETESPTMACFELPETGADMPIAQRFDFLDSKPFDTPAWNETVTDVDAAPVPTHVREASTRTEEERHMEAAPRLAWWLWLLVKVNRVFDSSTRCLGTPGRRLRSTRGRAVLGWIGVLFLGAALAWALLDWIVRRW